MEKQKRVVLKAREKEAIDCSSEIFWSFYLMFHVYFKFNNPTTPKINFVLTEMRQKHPNHT
jgi:hypothetical protein